MSVIASRKEKKGLGRYAALGLFSISILPNTSPTPVDPQRWTPPPPIFKPASRRQQAGTVAASGQTGNTGPSAPARPMTQAEKIILLSEFKSAQKSQITALRHQQATEIRELIASQKARRKEAEAQESRDRRKYFEEHPHGPERRNYVKELLARRSARDQIMADELASRKRENDIRLKALQDDQVQKLKEFQAALDRNEQPPSSLWSYR